MKEPFCGDCGANLLISGVTEVCETVTYFGVDISSGVREYDGEIETDYNGERFLEYDCGSCGGILNYDQISEIRSMEIA